MKKLIVVFGICFLVVAIIIFLVLSSSKEKTIDSDISENNLNNENTNENGAPLENNNLNLSKVGFCITMLEDALKYSIENNIDINNLFLFGSSADVLYFLNNKEIDVGIIGRKAKKSEINQDIQETVIKSGVILISRDGGFIDKEELKYIPIYTYLEESLIKDFFPEETIINYYETKQEVIEEAFLKNKPTLISWEDWNDEYNLLVVMNGEDKDKNFRGVFIYTSS